MSGDYKALGLSLIAMVGALGIWIAFGM